MKNQRSLLKTRRVTGEIGWKAQQDAWEQRVDASGDFVFDGEWPVGEASVSRSIAILEQKESIMRIEVWIGMFGGVPSRDQTGERHKTYTADSLADTAAHGQVQETTVTVYAALPKKGGGFHGRVRLYERDVHQLTPSASWEGTRGRELASPITCPAGTHLYYVTRTSQKDRGAHTRVSIELSR